MGEIIHAATIIAFFNSLSIIANGVGIQEEDVTYLKLFARLLTIGLKEQKDLLSSKFDFKHL